jgi:hypothetical protein
MCLIVQRRKQVEEPNKPDVMVAEAAEKIERETVEAKKPVKGKWGKGKRNMNVIE